MIYLLNLLVFRRKLKDLYIIVLPLFILVRILSNKIVYLYFKPYIFSDSRSLWNRRSRFYREACNPNQWNSGEIEALFNKPIYSNSVALRLDRKWQVHLPDQFVVTSLLMPQVHGQEVWHTNKTAIILSVCICWKRAKTFIV